MNTVLKKMLCLSFGIACAMPLQAENAPMPPISAPNYTEVIAKGRQLIRDALDKDASPTGLSVALVSNQQVIWSEGFGQAYEGQALSSDTAMLVGSVSKVFTAIAVMQLVEQGKVNLDEPYHTYVPEFSIKSNHPNWPVFTLRQMLNHSSGLPGDYGDGFYLEPPVDGKITGYRTLPQKVSQLYLAKPPEQMHGYSNLAFSLLGLLVERVSDKPFADYIQAHILDPLGMHHSSFELDERVQGRLSKGYVDGEAVDYQYIRDLPAGSLAATSDDMARFMTALLNGGEGILEQQTLEAMFTQQNAATLANDQHAPAMGLGFCLELPGRLQGLPVAWHNGGIRSDYAVMINLPESGLALTLMSSSSIDPDAIAEEVLALALEAKTGLVPPESKPQKKKLSAQQARDYEGYYFSPTLGSIWQIVAKGSNLQARTSEGVLSMQPYDDGSFQFSYKMFGFIPIAAPELEAFRLQTLPDTGATPGLQLAAGYSSVITGGHFSRIEPEKISKAWLSRVGNYRVENETPFNLQLRQRVSGKETLGLTVKWVDDEHGFLLLDAVPLSLVDDRFAMTMGKGRSRGETIEVLENGGLAYSGHLFSSSGKAP